LDGATVGGLELCWTNLEREEDVSCKEGYSLAENAHETDCKVSIPLEEPVMKHSVCFELELINYKSQSQHQTNSESSRWMWI